MYCEPVFRGNIFMGVVSWFNVSVFFLWRTSTVDFFVDEYLYVSCSLVYGERFFFPRE